MARARVAIAATGVALAAFVGGYEGLRQVPYLDAVQVPTVCFGHTSEVEPRWYSIEECHALLRADLFVAAKAVDRHVRIDIPQPTFDALVSFTFNVGEGNLRKSTLLRKLNSGDIRGACNELTRWVYAGGVKLRGLVTRRAAERDLCLKGVV